MRTRLIVLLSIGLLAPALPASAQYYAQTNLVSDQPGKATFVDNLVTLAGGTNIGSAHPQGGNRMGGIPGDYVVDSHSKAYGIDNLFVCDASVFPTSIGVNPQLTVMALAMRTKPSVDFCGYWQRRATI